jgi:hypothetical protein
MHPRLRNLLIAAPIPGALLFGLISSERKAEAPLRVAPVTAETGWSSVLAPEEGLGAPIAGAAHRSADEVAEAMSQSPQVSDPDRALFEERMRWAFAERLDTLPLGEIVARLGRTFVGTTYTPGVLDAEGPERLIINLRELDCVTYVENVLAMARMIKARNVDFGAYQAQLVRIRYRGGVLDGYPSRLHYFSDWIYDNGVKGVVRDLTRDLGGTRRPERINFMSSHPSSYRQLAELANLEGIRRAELEINRRPRYFIPQDRIAKVEDQLQDGDVIAMTSTVKGLDVVHTGIAVRVNGRVHLMHAPLVGKSVEISELPLAERIQSIESQNGIMVARPVM